MLDYEQIANDEFYEWFLAALSTPKKNVVTELLSQ